LCLCTPAFPPPWFLYHFLMDQLFHKYDHRS